MCREAGGRVSLNVRVGDLDLPPRGVVDQRRLEVVGDWVAVVPWRAARHRHNDGLRGQG